VFTLQDEFGEAREKLYLVRETKGALDQEALRGTERMKIDCGRRHFEAIGVDYGVATSVEELRRQVSEGE
jgi:type III restriction enzyme